MFSVVIPVYNCDSTIERVLDSVKNQSSFDLVCEIIIINDGSTDSTKLVIENYIQNNPNLPIIFIEQINHGVSYSRNRGIRLAKSEWIALLDADDIWLPNKLERQAELIKSNPEILFLGSIYPLKFVFKEHKGLHKLTPNELCLRSMPSTPSVVFKRSVGISLGLFNEDMHYCEDINFFQKFFFMDSYFVLAENLINIGIDKSYYASSGQSSNLLAMSKGRNRNVRELYDMRLISLPYMLLMIFINLIKLSRRILLRTLIKIKKDNIK